QPGNFVAEHKTLLGCKPGCTFASSWACPWLLQVPAQGLPATFKHLACLLPSQRAGSSPTKCRESAIQRNGRHLTRCTEALLPVFLHNTGLGIMNTWVTNDKRPNREEELWLNALLEKTHA